MAVVLAGVGAVPLALLVGAGAGRCSFSMAGPGQDGGSGLD